MYRFLSLMISLLFYSCSQQARHESTLPNVILIISDDQGWTDYGFMGHEHIETPRLDTLARESLCFTRGYATAPLCSPSLASLITGQYAFRHGITGNDPEFAFDGNRYDSLWRMERQVLYDSLLGRFYQQNLLTERLRSKGYRSLQTGKWWLGSWQDGHFDAGMTHGDPAQGGRHGDDGLKIGREGLDILFDFVDSCDREDDPFFVWYAPFLPHTPHNPPDSLLQKYRPLVESEFVAKYWAMCEWFDMTCGQIFDHLEARGLDEETIIIYTTDNGWIQKRDARGFAERSKRSPYEMGLRTPLMIRWPQAVEAEFDSTTFVSNIDIVPSILAAAGINDSSLPGINLTDKTARSTRSVLFAEAYAHDIADVSIPEKSVEYRVAFDSPYKLIWPDSANTGAQPELYNVVSDPMETKNVYAQHPDVVRDLKSAIEDWWMK